MLDCEFLSARGNFFVFLHFLFSSPSDLGNPQDRGLTRVTALAKHPLAGSEPRAPGEAGGGGCYQASLSYRGYTSHCSSACFRMYADVNTNLTR